VANKITEADLAKVKKFASLKKSPLLVIFFDDIESSGLVKQNIGEADYQKIRKYHDRILEEIINKKNEGEIVKSLGDGLFAIFYSPSIAVERAIEIQKKIYNHPYIKIRIGMDMGQVLEDASPGHTRDFFGPAVDCASRVMSMAKGGHILVTSSVYRDAVAILDRKLVTWRKHGLYKKKETDQPVELFEPYIANIVHPMQLLNGINVSAPEKRETKFSTSMPLFRRKRPLSQQQILDRAARAARRGGRRQRLKAIALYRQALKAEPNNPDLLRKIALLLVKTKDPANACKTYRQAIAELSKRGFFNRAVGVCREALRYLPRAVPLWKDLAALEVERGRRVDAVEALLQGRCQLRGRRSRAEAMELLIAAHHIDPVHLDANLDLASLLVRSGHRPRALVLLDGLVTAHPSSERRIRARQFRIAPGVHTARYWFRSLFRAV
jgi:class 3 adenylate cyclase/Tfp pilus assembly protein PilF